MSRLDPRKLHTTFGEGAAPDSPVSPRRYTLTHSDSTGDLYLTVAREVNRAQISGWYTRLLRDEVTAEWLREGAGYALRVYCHVSGGLVFGGAAMRDGIFRRELPLVLEAFRWGDGRLYAAFPALGRAPVWVHFRSANPRYNTIERWGMMADYRIQQPAL